MSRWAIEVDTSARRALKKLDKPVAVRILQALDFLAGTANPAAHCKALTGELTGLWRYRVGAWRILLDIDGRRITLVVVDVGHRGEVYD